MVSLNLFENKSFAKEMNIVSIPMYSILTSTKKRKLDCAWMTLNGLVVWYLMLPPGFFSRNSHFWDHCPCPPCVLFVMYSGTISHSLPCQALSTNTFNKKMPLASQEVSILFWTKIPLYLCNNIVIYFTSLMIAHCICERVKSMA